MSVKKEQNNSPSPPHENEVTCPDKDGGYMHGLEDGMEIMIRILREVNSKLSDIRYNTDRLRK